MSGNPISDALLGFGYGAGDDALGQAARDLAALGGRLLTDAAARETFVLQTEQLAGQARSQANPAYQTPSRAIDDLRARAARARNTYLEARKLTQVQGLSDAEFNSALAGPDALKGVALAPGGNDSAEAGTAAARALQATTAAESAAAGAVVQKGAPPRR